MFFDMLKYVYSESVLNKQMLKKFSWDKIKSTENALFFLSRASTYHNFTFNLLFLCALERKVRLSTILWVDFPFSIPFRFY